MKGSTVRLIIWSVFGALVLAVLLVLFFKPSLLAGISFSFPSFSSLRYENAELYTAGGGEVSGVVESIDIDWVNGEIKIEAYDGVDVVIEESANTNDEALLVHWYNDSGELKIRFAESGTHQMTNIVKDLTVKLPKKIYLDKLDIEVVSADIQLLGISGAELELVTVSGKVESDGISFDAVEAESVSGNIALSIAKDCVPTRIDCDSVSGNAILILDSEAGFTAEIDSVSGDFKSEFAIIADGKNQYRAAGRGNTEIDFDSVSGDLNVKMSK